MKRWGWTGWAFAVSALLAAGLCGLVYHFRTKAVSLKTEFDQATRDLDKMKKDRLTYRKLEASKQRMPTGSQVNSDDYQSFLESKWVAAGLTKDNYRSTPTNDGRPMGRWKEFPYTVTQNAAAASPIPRAKIIRFMELVETERPTFKSRELAMRFAAEPNRGDLASVTIVFSRFERQ